MINRVNKDCSTPGAGEGKGGAEIFIAGKGAAGEGAPQEALRVSAVTILVNLLLTLMKLVTGLISGSGAMISDAVHSASDVVSTFIVIAGVVLSGRKPDAEHEYGHERLECVASMLLAFLLAATGIGIGLKGIGRIAGGNLETLRIPGAAALIAAVISVIVKEWMFRYTKAAALRLHSGALMADAWHHRSDALSSVGAFAGILGARSGFPAMDTAASIVICVFILKASWDVFKDAMDKMIDRSCSGEKEEQMKKVISLVPGVEGIDLLKTRLFGSRIYVDVEISMDGSRTLAKAHEVAESVHDAVEKEFEEVKHCMVHVNPLPSEPVDSGFINQ